MQRKEYYEKHSGEAVGWGQTAPIETELHLAASFF